MVRRTAILLSLVTVPLVLSACQRLEAVRPLEGRGRGALPMEGSKYRDAIPAEYGDLIGVTSRADYPGWTQAWFMKPDKSIVVVWINSTSGDVYDKVMMIPRR